ncbi:MAG: hypothetical protein RXO35_01745 [Candidatus Micrarchaeota archaeon]
MKQNRKGAGSNVAPPILVILGGFLVLVSGLYSYLLKPQYTTPNFATFVQFGMNSNLSPFTMVLGLMIIGTGILLFTKNKMWVTMWSATAIVFGILSIFSGGGFLLGMILVFIGGFLKLFYASSS